MRELKSQLEQVQLEAANLKLKLTTAQDESGSVRQEVTITTNKTPLQLVCNNLV